MEEPWTERDALRSPRVVTAVAGEHAHRSLVNGVQPSSATPANPEQYYDCPEQEKVAE